MDVGAHQRKGVEGTPGGGNIVAELIDVSLPIRLIGTEIASIYSPDNHVVQGARCVQAGVSRHEPILYFRQGRCQYNSHWETTSPKLSICVFEPRCKRAYDGLIHRRVGRNGDPLQA